MERYENAVWQNGTVITAASLNRIEEKLHEVVDCVIGMGSEVSSNELTVGDSNANVTSSNGNLTATNKIQAGKLQVGTPQTETEIGNGSALIAGNIEIKGTTTIAAPLESNHAATKGYVDGQISTINDKTINSGNTGIVSSGTLGGGITLTLQHATDEILGGIKVGDNLTINETTGELSGNYSVATASAAGLMSAAHFTKLEGISENATSNIGTVTGISINGGATQSPTNDGVINISDNIVTSIKMNNSPVTISNGEANLGTIITSQDITGKANTASPNFSGIAHFGNNIQIDSGLNTITIGSAVLNESQLNILYSILPQDNIQDGVYTLKLVKSTSENNEPEFIYVWELVNNAGGGE